jgi:NitT/TauT family transport system substrate-binding protein
MEKRMSSCSIRSLFSFLAMLWFVVTPAAVAAGEPVTIRIGILQYGTANWELDVMERMGLAAAEGVRLKLVPLALKDAANIAIQGGAVDVIVTDWIWVARQRAEGRDYTFAPYSRAVGGVMVRPDAGAKSIADLRGKRLGVGGGALDKSWLLLRAYARKTLGEDAATLFKPDFAAPPLLNALMLKGEIPAALTTWNFAARLRASGMQEILSMDEMLRGLGVQGELPMLGWVFSEAWAERNRFAVEGFLRASEKAKKIMRESDPVWEELQSLTRAEDAATRVALRDGFRAGIPAADSRNNEAVARKVLNILSDEGGAALVGAATSLPNGTFWRTSTNR